jgi:hypothetical protein
VPNDGVIFFKNCLVSVGNTNHIKVFLSVLSEQYRL